MARSLQNLLTTNFSTLPNGYTGSQGVVGFTGSQGAGYTGSSGTIGYTGSGSAGGSGLFNTSINNATNYAVTSTMANAVVFASNSLVHSIYITNIDSVGSANISVSANLRLASGNTVVMANQIPMPYRSAMEMLKKPKVMYTGDAIQLQAFDGAIGANNDLHATIVYETITSTSYIGQSTNVIQVATETDVYTSSGAASVVESVLVLNNSNVGNIAVTISVTNSSNTVQGYFASRLLVPINSMIELCENPRYLNSGDKIRANVAESATVSIHTAGRKI